jgi:hypothetical protein
VRQGGAVLHEGHGGHGRLCDAAQRNDEVRRVRVGGLDHQSRGEDRSLGRGIESKSQRGGAAGGQFRGKRGEQFKMRRIRTAEDGDGIR